MKPKVAIIGAGFSGLSLAWALAKNNIECEIFEAQNKTGGMIASEHKPILVESAANAVMASAHFEELLQDLNIQPVKAGFKSKSRWIFRNRPKKFPLSSVETFKALYNLLICWLKSEHKPKENENLKQWCQRVLSNEFCNYLLSPAMQGIYSTSAENLSAELIIGSLFKPDFKLVMGQQRGSISAPQGMQQIIDELTQYLVNRNIKIHYQQQINLEEVANQFNVSVVATSLKDVPALIKNQAPLASQLLEQVPLLPLSTVVMGFETDRSLKGFGCLFPPDQNIKALGVLFNSDIFENRGPLENETWIYALKNHNEESLKQLALNDRELLLNVKHLPVVSYVKAWSQALPLYGEKLREVLVSDIWEVQQPIKDPFDVFKSGAQLKETKNLTYLTGNYLGGIGLAKILDYNLRLTQKIITHSHQNLNPVNLKLK